MALDFSTQAVSPDTAVDTPSAADLFADRIQQSEHSREGQVSPKGAQGVMQVMPATQMDPGFGVTPAKDDSPEERKRVGRDYAKALYNHYGENQTLAAAAYNAGPGHLDQWLAKYGDPRSGKISDSDFARAIPVAETRDYTTPYAQTASADGAPDFSAQAKPLDFSAQAAPAVAPPKDIGIGGEFGKGVRQGTGQIGSTLNKQGVTQASETTSPFETAAEAMFPPLAGAKAFLQGIGLMGTAPPEKPTTGDEPISFKGPVDVHSVAEKLARGAGQTVPTAGAASIGGIPAAAETAFDQTYGPKLAEFQAQNPHDPVGNQLKATGEATVDAAATAIGWKLFEFTPFKHEVGSVVNDVTGEISTLYKKTVGDTIKNVATQVGGIQPAVAVVNQAFNNLLEGKPITDGMPQSVVQGGIINTLMMGVTHVLHPPGLEASPWRKPAEGEFTPYNPSGLDQGPIIDQGGPQGRGPAGAAGLLPNNAAPPPDSAIGIKFPDGSVQRATVEGYGANGSTVRLKYEDGTTAEHLTSEVMRDRAAPPPPRFDTEVPKPYQRQLGPDEGKAPAFGEAPPEGPGSRAQARMAGRQPQPVLDPQTIHDMDLADRLENAASDPGNPMSTQDRLAAMMQVARLRQQFQSQGEEAIPGRYRHPAAGEPAQDLGELGVARATNPAAYETIGESGNVSQPSAGDTNASQKMPDLLAANQPNPPPAMRGVLQAVPPSDNQGANLEGQPQDRGNGPGSPADARAAAIHDEQAAVTDTNPSPAQAAAGNYKHGKLTVQGIPVSIETPKGAMREGVGANGEPWQNRNNLAHYGYIPAQGQIGTDGDHIDAYVGPHPESPVAFVVDQVDPKTGTYDEHKAILGARTEGEARDIYNAGFSDGSGPSRMGAITKMPLFPFKEWLKTGDLQRPLNAMADQDYQSALWDVRDARSKSVGDRDLLTTIKAMGGIKLVNNAGATTAEGQTVRQIFQDHQRPGLINNRSGVTPDYLREALTEQGWFGDRDTSQSDLHQLYDMLDRAVRGQKVFHPESDANSILERRALTDEEMGRAGVLSTDSHADAAKKLLDFRRQGIEELAEHYEDAADEEVEKLSPGAIELLTQYGYEPGADHGAEHEIEPQPEEPQRAAEAQREAEPSHEGQEHGGAGAVEPESGGEAAPKEPEREFRTTPGAIAAEHEAEVSSLEAQGTLAARPKHLTEDERAAKVAKIKALLDQAKPLSDKGDLTAKESATYVRLMREADDLRFEIARPLSAEKIKSETERKSTLPASIVVKAQHDLLRDKSVFGAIIEAAHGVSFDANTPVDEIMLGNNKAVSPQKFYQTFDATREAMRGHFGPSIKLFRAEGRQIPKPTKNWATTREYAEQFGDNVISKDVPIEDVLAVNVGLKGGYHEIIVGEPPHDMSAAEKKNGLPEETVDLGRGVEAKQAVIPGAEQSAKQLAQAREASGHGRVKAKAEQKEPAGLFEAKAPAEPDMFATTVVRRTATTAGARIPPREPEMLTDVGEKIGGARKDKWAERGLRVSDLEGMSEGEAFQHTTKDQVWPKPDYEKMVASGVEPKAAAYIKIIRDRLAAKPSVDSAEGRRNYIEMMGHVREALSGAKTEQDVRNARDAIVYEHAGVSRNRLGTPEDKAAREKLFSVYKDRQEPFGVRYADARKADKMIADGFPGKAEPWTRRFGVRKRGNGQFDVTEKNGYRPLSEPFDTKEEAEAQASKLYDAALAEGGGNVEPKRPHLDKIERTGKDIRNGRDVTGDDFIKDFGFRGIEFGNWVASDERQKAVNLAYDGLHDLAGVIGVPPETLSLDGHLGLAFGARGSGKFAAHYEPGRLVINLTKLSGAGSLAHEWAHALDHYFGTLDTGETTRGEPKGASGWYKKTEQRISHLKNLRPPMAEAFDKLMGAIFKRNKVRAEAVRDAELRLENRQAAIAQQEKRLEAVKDDKTNQKFIRDSREWIKSQQAILEATGRRLAELRDETKPYIPAKINSSYYDNAIKLSGKSGSDGYWARPTEMFARAFEGYVFDKLEQEGNKSQYLVQGVEPERYEEGYKGNPYPTGMERKEIDDAFDHLFKTMEVREGATGRKVLAQTPNLRAEPIQPARGPGEVSSRNALPPAGSAGEGRDKEGARLPETPEEKRALPKGLKQQTAKPFFSALTRSVEAIKQEKAPAAQWSGIIDNLKGKGVKDEEIQWSGVKDWLAEHKGPVTKADLVNFLRANEVRVEEVLKGGAAQKEPDNIQARHRFNQLSLDSAAGEQMTPWDSATMHWLAAHPDATDTEYLMYEYDQWLNNHRHLPRLSADELAEELGEMVANGKRSGPEVNSEMQWLRDFTNRWMLAESEIVDQPSNTKWGTYTLPGGKNYRELLLTLPEGTAESRRVGNEAADYAKALREKYGEQWLAKANIAEGAKYSALVNRQSELEGQPYKSGHWDEPNILAHVRFDDRTGPNGEKILHVAEVQSDWHQQGRKGGYTNANLNKAIESSSKIADLDEALVPIMDMLGIEDGGVAAQFFSGGKAQEWKDGDSADRAGLLREWLRLENAWEQGAVPDAPFKTTWPELAMKRMLRYAAEKGYDRLSWDTGETNADRYDLSKTISEVVLHDNNSGGIGRPQMHGPFKEGNLHAFDLNGRQVISQYVRSPEEIVDLVGKDVAEKLLNATPVEKRSAGLGVRERSLKGLALRVGGEGMRGFYDDILPKAVGKLIKKWDGKVETSRIPGDREHEVPYRVAHDGDKYWVEDRNGKAISQKFDTAIKAMNERDAMRVGPRVHSVDITDAMRKGVMEGQPLFQRGLPTIWADIGGTKRLAPDFYARMPRIPSHDEAALIEQVNRIVKQIVPGAKVIPAKELTYRGNKIWGAMYVDGPRAAIAWALEGPDAVNAIHHEALHWLRNVGAFTPQEWETLSNAAINDRWLHKHDIHNRYSGEDFSTQIEEAIAEEYASWAQRETTPPPPVRTLFGRIRAIMARIGKYLRSLYGDTVKADDIFRKILSGEIGNRQPADGWKPSAEVFAQAAKTPEGPPETPAEGRDYIDATTNDLAEHMRSKGPGTYERTLQNLTPLRGPEIFAKANWAQREFVGPRTVAEIDTKSGRFWAAIQKEDDEAATRLHDLRDNIRDNFLKLPRENQDRVNAVMELDRLENRTRSDDGRSIVARNTEFADARGSKPGDGIILSPEETKAYFGLQRMYRHAWDNIMEGSARRMGWQRPWSPSMADNFKEIQRAIDTADGQRNRKAFQRIHDVLSAMEEQRRQAYMPLMRFGDYYFSVTPKYDKESTGGFPESSWFSLAERPSFQYADVDPSKMLRFETTQSGQIPDYAKDQLAQLQAKYPSKDFRINHGYLLSKPDMLRQMSIPAIEKLMMLLESGVMDRMKTEASMEGTANKGAAYKKAKEDWQNLYEELVDAVRDEMYEQIKAGFKKRSRTVPGYSNDWNRVLGSYMGWTSKHVAKQIHGDTIERLYDDIQTSHPHQSIRGFWADWKRDDDSPMSPLSRIGIAANQVGFLYTMAMNPASTMSIAMHGPTYAIPTLGTGIGVPKAAAAFTKAYGEATAAIRWDDKHGAVIDHDKVGKTPDERAFLKEMAAAGYLHAKGADDIRSMAEKSSAIWGDYTPHTRHAMDILSSNIAVADQANRVAASLAAYRLARDGNLGHMNATWGGNQVWRAISQEEGVSPESMGKFLLNQSVGEWGGRSRSKFGRSFFGRMASSLHGFQIRFLSNMLKQAFRQGTAGRIALAWSMAALWAAAGLQGLPFVQDTENAADYIWKFFTKHDPMIAWRLRAMLVDTGLGKTGADMIMRGPLSTATGIDFASRLGFGDVITRDIAPFLGASEQAVLTFPSIVFGAVKAFRAREGSHQPVSAAASLLPGAIRHPIQAVEDAEHGVKSQSGKHMYVPARKFTAADEAKEAAGFTPLDVARAREHAEFQYRAKTAHGSRPPDTVPR